MKTTVSAAVVCAAVMRIVWRGPRRPPSQDAPRNATPNGRPTRPRIGGQRKDEKGLRGRMPRTTGAHRRCDARQGTVQDRGRGEDLVPHRHRRVGQSAVEGLSHQRRARVTARPSAAPICARRKARLPASTRQRRQGRQRNRPELKPRYASVPCKARSLIREHRWPRSMRVGAHARLPRRATRR